jgi:GTP-binding protein Era
MTDAATRCGYVAILGQPNVGKSTLLNHILGQKISITSRKPQTTRHQILGVKTADDVQTIYVDTPGIHQNSKNALNRYMNRAATSVINGVNVIVFMVVADRWSEDDDWILKKIKDVDCPLILAINKIDMIKDKHSLLPLMQAYSEKANFMAVVPLSAKTNKNVEELEAAINQHLPAGPLQFPEDQITDRSQRFLTAEIVREKLMRLTGDEIPYSVTLEVEEFVEKKDIIHISVLILVDKKSHKGIVIGKNGDSLKEVGKQARHDLEKMLDSKVFLRLWVKVREGWADDERALNSLGYQDT